jgi:Cu/Ag efflux pump CusA
LVIGVVGILIAPGVGALFSLNSSFLPELREGNIIVHMTAVPGTSLEESLRQGDQLTQVFLPIPSVRSVAQRVGRAELGTDTMGTHQSEIDVNLQALNGAQ